MIRCDMEGVSGVVSYLQAEPGRPEYAFGRAMFQFDLMACLEGLLSGGAGEIVIYDEHFFGRNVDPAWLPDQVSVICGKPPYRAGWAGGLDSSFAGVILLGLHSKAGTRNGLLNHSYEPDIRDLRLNGISVGEIGMEASIAGDFGVPVLLVTGDSAGMREAERLLPGVRTVRVKESISVSGGKCHPSSVTAVWIRDAARLIVENPPHVRPRRAGPRVRLEITFNQGPYLEAFRGLYAGRMQNDRSIVLKGHGATEVWAEYWEMKLRAQGIISS